MVRHLEAHGYVHRVPDPTDGRAKLVLPTDRGNEVIEIAQSLAPEAEELISAVLGPDRTAVLRADLEALLQGLPKGRPA